jgi:branched-chain amino acid transport system substrate-binding protein
MNLTRIFICTFTLATTSSAATKQYGPGVSDTEIKIGNIMPYSGPASAYGTTGKAQAAFFRMINERGGVNGRKINFISLDGAYSPPKTLEVARRLVEREQVLLIFSPIGTAPNIAIQKYLNTRKVPQLLISTGASRWNDPVRYPWTMGFQPDYQSEARVYAAHILRHTPNARIGVLYQNDDYGKDYLTGFKDGLGAHTKMIVAELSYEVTAPSVDSQIVQMKGAGAEVFFNVCTPKFAAQAIRKAYDIGWRPVQYLNGPARSIGAVINPAGPDKARGIICSAYLKDPTDPHMASDRAVVAWREFMAKYYPDGSLDDSYNVSGYAHAETLVHVLQQAGDNLTRENVMKQAASLRDFEPTMVLSGIKLNTSATDYAPVESVRMMQFDGQHWSQMGELIEHPSRL